jgi:hypothetical protein
MQLKTPYSKFFLVPLTDALAIEVEYAITAGIPVPFVVRLMTQIAGKKHCISRFDSAHLQDSPHRDILGLHSGLRGKVFYPELDYRCAVQYAILDFKAHGQNYFQDFLLH